jgi:uncharacterized protein with PQ loop repeat
MWMALSQDRFQWWTSGVSRAESSRLWYRRAMTYEMFPHHPAAESLSLLSLLEILGMMPAAQYGPHQFLGLLTKRCACVPTAAHRYVLTLRRWIFTGITLNIWLYSSYVTNIQRETYRTSHLPVSLVWNMTSINLSTRILTNSVAQELEGSSPHSQQPATGPCPEIVESNPHPPSQSP